MISQQHVLPRASQTRRSTATSVARTRAARSSLQSLAPPPTSRGAAPGTNPQPRSPCARLRGAGRGAQDRSRSVRRCSSSVCSASRIAQKPACRDPERRGNRPVIGAEQRGHGANFMRTSADGHRALCRARTCSVCYVILCRRGVCDSPGRRSNSHALAFSQHQRRWRWGRQRNDSDHCWRSFRPQSVQGELSTSNRPAGAADAADIA